MTFSCVGLIRGHRQVWISCALVVSVACIITTATALDACSPAAFTTFPALAHYDKDIKDLELTYQAITHVPDGAFARFPNVLTIDLSFNSIRSISHNAFQGLQELRVLKLNNNCIETLSGTAEGWVEILKNIGGEVHLGNNPFVCNCSMIWLRELLVTEETFFDSASVRCGDPPEWKDLQIKTMPTHIDTVCKGTGASLGLEFCSSQNKFPCSTNLHDGPISCIPQAQICDGTVQCLNGPNGADESPFICNGFRPLAKTATAVDLLPSKDILSLFSRLIQNFLGLQPLHSATATVGSGICRTGTFKCFTDTCISRGLVCNGKLDCTDGADEEVIMCSKLTTLKKTAPASTTYAPVTRAKNSSWSLVTLEELKMDLVGVIISTSPPSVFPVEPTNFSSATKFEELGPWMADAPLTMELPMNTASSSVNYKQTDVPTHPTMTFPQMNGSAHVNDFYMNSPEEDMSTKSSVELSSPRVTASSAEVNNALKELRTVPVPSEGYLQAQHVRVINNLTYGEITVTWEPPNAELDRSPNWRLLGYIVTVDFQHPGTRKQKKSTGLATFIHKYLFHHLLPDDSLKIVVKARFQDLDNLETYEIDSEPVLIRPEPKLMIPPEKKDLIISSAKQVNYPGKMGFEDLLGIAVGGTLAGLMVVLLGVYIFKRKKASSQNSIHGTHGRTLRMRKIERPTLNDRTLSTEPIYSEPEYVHQQGLSHHGNGSLAFPTKGKIPGTLKRSQSVYAGHATVNPEDSYVQVLESDSSCYGPLQSRSCSEYSCYSVPGKNPVMAANARRMSSSDYGSFAVYDSDNCSVGYYYHNAGLVPRCVHTNAPVQNFKHFGDTLTSCHGVPAASNIFIPCVSPHCGAASASTACTLAPNITSPMSPTSVEIHKF